MPTETANKTSSIATKENPPIMLSLILRDFFKLSITRIYI